MRRFVSIAINTFMELARQPVFLLLLTAAPGLIIFAAGMPYFGLGEDPKLVKDSSLAIMLTTGLFGAVTAASASLAHEIRVGTALTVLAKPIGRIPFLLAKFLGVAAGLTLLTFVNLVATLQASRMVFDAYSGTDWAAVGLFSAAALLAYLAAGFANYFLERPFVESAVFLLAIFLTLAFIVTIKFTTHEWTLNEQATVEWRLVPAGLLILFAVLILAGLALACSTRLELIPTLAVCGGFFLLGLMSDYLFGRPAVEDGAWWAKIVYGILPNWQLFWMSDALESGKSIPFEYLGRGFLQMVFNLGFILSIALFLFEDRELS